jgi:hypothetical protein
VRRHLLYACILSHVFAAALGCGDQTPRDTVEVFGRPVALDEQVVWIDHRNQKALLLNVAETRSDAGLVRYPVPDNPVVVERRNGHNELLLLARGAGPDDGVLSLLGPKKVTRQFRLGPRFDRLAQSHDGRYAMVSFSTSNDDEDSLLFNPNQIAIIDLDADPKSAVVGRSLRGFGSVPASVAFSPEMTVAGETRRVAVVLFDSHVSLLDLNHLDHPEYTIEFSRQGKLGLTNVKFDPQEQKIYVTAVNSSDVYVVTLLPAGDNRANDFDPSLNQLGAGARPFDMALYKAGTTSRLLTVSGNSVQVIESGSNRVTTIPLAVAADRILLFAGKSPFDDAIEQRALLYNSGASVVTFLDLDDVEERKTRNLETLQLSGAVSQLTALEDNLVLLLRTNGLGMLDLEGRSASELSSRADLSQAVATPELNRLWIRPNGRPALAYLDFAAGRSTPGQVALISPIEDLLIFSNLPQPRVVVTHGAIGGSVTMLDATDPTDAAKALTVSGFFYDEVLNVP